MLNDDGWVISFIFTEFPPLYAGYAAQNIFEINSHFGTVQDLISLVEGKRWSCVSNGLNNINVKKALTNGW